MQIHQDIFEKVVSQAREAAQHSRRWQSAIERATEIIETNPYITMDGDKLTVLSDSGVIYEVTPGRCMTTDGQMCPAYADGQPCKHRALRRLVLRYQEKEMR